MEKLQFNNQAANTILKMLHKEGYEAYFVGGCVRDALLKRVINDYDITTNATSEQMLVLKDKYDFSIIPTGLQHGTLTFVLNHEHIEVTTFRQDGTYSNHRQPDHVTFTTSLLEDVKRRDFSMNALCYDGCRVVDLVGGLDDIKHKRIRAIGDASKRFNEDALRILRAIRFSYTLDFEIENNTYHAIQNSHHLLQSISKERIRDEFIKILMSNHKDTLLDLIRANVAFEIIPELSLYLNVSQETPYHMYDVLHHVNTCLNNTNHQPLEIKLAILLHDIEKKNYKTMDDNCVAHFKGHAHASARLARKILQDLKFTNKQISYVYSLIYYHDYYVNPTSSSVRKFLYQIHGNYDLAFDILNVQRIDNKGKAPNITIEKNALIDEVETMIHESKTRHEAFNLKDLAVDGNDMLVLGYKEKDIGIVLKKLLRYVLNQQEYNTKEHLLKVAGGMKDEIISSK